MSKQYAVGGSRGFFALKGAATTLGAAALSLAAPAAEAAVIDFENTWTGWTITNQFQASHGVTFSADNYRADGPDAAIIFNSDYDNTADDDLEFGVQWSAGNIRDLAINKMLIVAENLRDVHPQDGRVDKPDDEAEGGTLMMKFSSPQTSLGFDLVDVELTPELDRVEFLRQGVPLLSISFDQFANPASPFHEPGVVYADRSANRISPMSIADLGIAAFDEVRWYMPECAAIDNIVFDDAPVIPEPATAALMLGALVPALAARRRRR